MPLVSSLHLYCLVSKELVFQNIEVEGNFSFSFLVVVVVLEMEPRVLVMSAKCSTIELHTSHIQGPEAYRKVSYRVGDIA